MPKKNPRSNKPQEPMLLGDVMLKYKIGSGKSKYVTKEFQDFGYMIAATLGDEKRAGMYIKFAKTHERVLLESALRFVKDAKNARNKAALFMWKLKQLKDQKNDK